MMKSRSWTRKNVFSLTKSGFDPFPLHSDEEEEEDEQERLIRASGATSTPASTSVLLHTRGHAVTPERESGWLERAYQRLRRGLWGSANAIGDSTASRTIVTVLGLLLMFLAFWLIAMVVMYRGPRPNFTTEVQCKWTLLITSISHDVQCSLL